MKQLLAALFLMVILCSCGEKPEANFTWSPANPKAGEEVKFTNLSLNARSYSWNFGDMSIGSEKNPVHVYKNDGDYIIDLNAFNGLRSDIKTVTIAVSK
jgi:PKD repeat protein